MGHVTEITITKNSFEVCNSETISFIPKRICHIYVTRYVRVRISKQEAMKKTLAIHHQLAGFLIRSGTMTFFHVEVYTSHKPGTQKSSAELSL